MFFQPKLIAGCTVALGIGIPSYLYCGGGCLSPYIVIPWNSELGSTNSILDCRSNDGNRDYSVYLAFAEEKVNESKKLVTFKVVDNKTSKVMWGPNADSQNKWDDWAIEISFEDLPQETTSGEKKQKKITEIKVPTDKQFKRDTIRVGCQKSMVQMKKNTGERDENCCKGTFLRSQYMNFELKPENFKVGWFGKKICDINLVRKVEWNTNFQPQAVLCNS